MRNHRKINWGILGAGRIAYKFVQDLQLLTQENNMEVLAVGACTPNKARLFAAQHTIARCYTSYEALVSDHGYFRCSQSGRWIEVFYAKHVMQMVVVISVCRDKLHFALVSAAVTTT